MRSHVAWCICLAGLLLGGNAHADDAAKAEEGAEGEEGAEAEEGPEAGRPLIWDKEKAPDPETFIEEDAPEGLIGAPGPWDLHPEKTPIISGPWAVDRPGTAPSGVDRDDSTREPKPPVPSWGNSTGEPDDAEDSPWSQARENTTVSAEPLGAHFPVRILGHEPDALLIELPMLIAQSPSSFKGPDYWLIVEFFIDGKKVGDHRMMVTKVTLATMGPTHAWVKAMVPTPRPKGELTIRVLRLEAGTNEIRPMFQRKVSFGK